MLQLKLCRFNLELQSLRQSYKANRKLHSDFINQCFILGGLREALFYIRSVRGVKDFVVNKTSNAHRISVI